MLYTLFFFLLTYFILTHSDISLYYAFHGFTLWYSKMIPSLLPFMIISGILVRMNLTEAFSSLLHPILGRIFRCSKNISYVILLGFLCGFPMGAKVISDLLTTKKITQTEAQYALCFCNNIGPVYFMSFAMPLLGLQSPLPYLIGMYGIPLLYGIFLRYTLYRNAFSNTSHNTLPASHKHTNLLEAMDTSISGSIQSILMLCGYMVLFNLLNILPHFLFPDIHKYLAPLLEITGGLSLLKNESLLYSLCLLQFGGLSCIAQTYTLIHSTKLSIVQYIYHKILLTGLTFIYYTMLFSNSL